MPENSTNPERLAELLATLRTSGDAALGMFCDDHAAGLGGMLILKAGTKGFGVPEAGYRSARFDEILRQGSST